MIHRANTPEQLVWELMRLTLNSIISLESVVTDESV
jgi:hypothetical protein